MPRNTGVKSKVVAWLLDHPNTEVHASRIARETGVSERQVTNAMYGVKATLHIVNVSNNVYRYVPDKDAEESSSSKTGALYSQVGVAGNGDHVIEDETGKLYRAVPL